MVDRDRQGPATVQRGQGRDADVCQSRAGRGLLAWRYKRSFRVVLVCLFLLVLALAYAIATGKPIPEIAGRILGILLQVLLGGM